MKHAVTLTALAPHGGGLSNLLSLLAIWRWRARFRWELAQKARANPHLIDDIGLTKLEVEREIAKPFWQS